MPTTEVLEFSFIGSTVPGTVQDESWGIDNILIDFDRVYGCIDELAYNSSGSPSRRSTNS